MLEVSWCELQDCLRTKVTCLDDLIHQHERYLHRVLFRCLLNSKAAPVMKIITDIFGTITRFSSLTGQGEESLTELEKLYRSFSVYSRSKLKIVACSIRSRCYLHLNMYLMNIYSGSCIQWWANCLQGDTSLTCR